MDAQWLYLRNGFMVGPVTTKQLANLILDRQLKRSSIVCSLNNGRWCEVSEVKEVIRIVNRSIAGNCKDDKELRQFRSFLAMEGMQAKTYGFDSLGPIFATMNWLMFPFWSVLTLGLFQVYWFFRQGMRLEAQNARHKSFLSKFSIFIFLTPFLTLLAIEGNKQFRRVKLAPFNPYLLSLLWYIAVPLCFVRLLPSSHLLSYLLNLLAFIATHIPLIMAQKYINDCNELLGF